MKVKKVRVCIVGLGLVSYSHIKAYLSHPDAELVAVCDLDEKQAKAIAQKCGVEKYYTDFNEMLRDEEINLVDICTPTFTHVKMAVAAAEAKKHILCEKPFCMNLEEGRVACEAAKKNGVLLAVEESYRFMTSIRKAKELIDGGKIGKPTQIRQRFGEWIWKNDDVNKRETTEFHRGWRTNTERAGGNGFPWMFDHCVHFFTTAEYLMGESRIKEVYAMISDNSWRFEKGNQKSERNEVGDIDILTWTYDDPACKGVWMTAEKENGRYDYMTGFSATVIGDKGMIEVLGEGGDGLMSDGKKVHLILYRSDGTKETFRFEEGEDDNWKSEVSYYSQAHINLIHSFIDSIVNGRPAPYSGEDGLRDLKSTLAAICSAKEGRPVRVNEVTDERYLNC